MKMNIKMILSDLDNTLLFDAESLSPKTNEVLKKAVSKGIIFVPVTGRHFRCIPECIQSLPGEQFEISSNGAMIRDVLKGDIIFAGYFVREALRYLLDLAKEYGKPFELYQRDRILMDPQAYECLRQSPGLRSYILKCFGSSVLVPDIEAALEKDSDGIHKFLIRDLSQSLYQELYERVNSSGLAEAASSLSGNLEISPININKGSALRYLCEFLGLPTAETAAFGDGTNDIPMLDAAGISAAVMDAPEEVKKHANYVVPDHKHDGPALFIENHLL